ncbi:Channel-forming transporter/cytolysins activator of TpsB family [hydrothermal vent metagenome]|uniref:Channel-forming transporter/cytolysins activator of TpsB family n=1 Tax=hydrothermal vent metagenome TaxID=652676 RepID=A0A1W1CL99_9ZZZZ
MTILLVFSKLYAINLEESLEERLKASRTTANSERLKNLVQTLPKYKVSPNIQTKFVKEDKCINIERIDVIGISILPKYIINTITNPFVNKCLGKNNINNIIKLINNFYFQYGFITTRTYLPKQKSSRGVLKLIVVEGKVNNLSSTDKNLYLNNLFSYKKGEYLNMRDIEQGIDQINRLQSYQAKADIQPTNEVGYSNIVIKNNYKSNVNFRGGLDNSGSENTGEILANMGVSINNITGMNDQLLVDLKSNLEPSIEDNLNRTISIAYDIPYLYYNFGVKLSETKSASIVNGNVIDFVLKNTNLNTEIYLKKNIYRDDSKKVLLNLSFNRKDKLSQINSSNIDNSTYKRDYLSIGVNLSGRTKQNSVFSLDFKIKQGLYTKVVFHDQFGRETTQPINFPDEKFIIFNLGGSYNTNVINNKVNLKLELESQYSNENLFGGELFQIGGASSVRGHKNKSLSGSKGVYVRSTISFVDLSKHIPLNPLFYILYDAGHIFSDENFNGGTLGGKGIGVQLSLFKQNFSMEYAESDAYNHDSSFNVGFNFSF